MAARTFASLLGWPLLLLVQGTVAAQALPPETTAWLDAHAVKVATLDFDASCEDLAPLRAVLKDVRLVMLGEQSHSDGAAFLAKDRLIRFLHEQLGFNVLVFEAGLFECDRANDLLGEGRDLKQVMGSFQQGCWCVSQVMPLLEYVARSQATDRPLWLAGFDSQGTGASRRYRVPDLLRFGGDLVPLSAGDREALLRLGELSSLTYRPDQLPDRNIPEALGRYREAFARASRQLERRSGVADTQFYFRVLLNLQAYERQMRAYQAGGGKAGETANNERDRQMADNLIWLAEQCYPQEKLVCWAATRHLMHGSRLIKRGGRPYYETLVNMGDQVKEHFGERAYVVGFTAHHGTIGSPFRKDSPVPTPAPGSLEDLLYRYGPPLSFLDLRPPGPLAAELSCSCLGYAPMQADWSQVLDGLFFTAEMTPSTPMH